MMAEVPDSTLPTIRNSEFLAALARQAPNGSKLWVCGFHGNPGLTDSANWGGRPYDGSNAAIVDGWDDRNTYLSTAALQPDALGDIRRRKNNLARLLILAVDDVQLADLLGRVSYVIETSPGKFQAGIIIDGADRNATKHELLDRIMVEFGKRGMVRADMSGNNAVRYVRLPRGVNQKPREGGHWAVQARVWSPDVVMSLDDACSVFGVDLDALRGTAAANKPAIEIKEAQDAKLRSLMTDVLRGEALHERMNVIAASLVASRVPAAVAVNMLRALMECTSAPRDDRWAARYADIPRSVSTAVEKFKPEDEEPAPTASPIKLLDTAALEQAFVATSWLVKHTVPAASVGVMFGASGTGKSFVALDFGLHVVHGLKWMGKKTKKGRVLFIAAEGGAGVWKRIKAWHKANGRSWKGIDFYVLPRAVVIGQACDEIIKAAAELGIEFDLVIVDTMSQTFSGEENSANEVAAYFRALGDSFRALWNCCVMVIHHSGHLATERPRGSSAITANTDFMFGVFRDADQMLTTVECHKQKDDEKFAAQTFKLSRHAVGFDEDGEEISSLCASHVADEAEVVELKAAEASIGRACRDDVVMSLAVSGMTEREWRLASYSVFPSSMTQDSKKHAFYRAKDALVKAGRIGLVTIPGRPGKTITVMESGQ